MSKPGMKRLFTNMAIAILMALAFMTSCHPAMALPTMVARQDANPCIVQGLCEDEYFEFIEMIDIGAVTFKWCEFQGVTFRGNISGSEFYWSYLEAPWWENVDFSRSSWTGTIVSRPSMFKNFTFADSMFMHTVFKGFVIELGGESSFVDIMVDRFNMGRNNFTEANFTGAKVEPMSQMAMRQQEFGAPVPMIVASYQTGFDVRNPLLSFQLEGANLEGADFRGANLTGGVFALANINGTNFQGADLSFTNIYMALFSDETNIEGANLTGAVGFYEALGEGCADFCGQNNCSCDPINYCESAGTEIGPRVTCESMRLNYYRQFGALNDAQFSAFQMEAVTFLDATVPEEGDPVVNTMDVSNFTLMSSLVNRIQLIRPKNAGSNSTNPMVKIADSLLNDVIFLGGELDGVWFNETVQHGVQFVLGALSNINYTDTTLLAGPAAELLLDQHATDNGFAGSYAVANPQKITASKIRLDRVQGDFIGGYAMTFFYGDFEDITIVNSNLSLAASRCDKFMDMTIQNSVIQILTTEESNIKGLHINGSQVWALGFSGSAPRQALSRRGILGNVATTPQEAVEELLHGSSVQEKGKPEEYKTFEESMFSNAEVILLGFRGLEIRNFTIDSSAFGGFGFENCELKDSEFMEWYAYAFGLSNTDVMNTTFDSFYWDYFDIFHNSTMKDVMVMDGFMANGTLAGVYNDVSFINVQFKNVTFIGYPSNFTNVLLNGSNVANTTGLYAAGECETFCTANGCCCEGVGTPCANPSPSATPTTVGFASVSPTASVTAQPDDSDPCFSGSSFVELEDGKTILIGALQIGDRVRVGEKEFSEVYLFGHKDADAVSRRFVSLTFESGQVLEISDIHLLYVDGKLQAAKHAKAGDMVTLGNGGSSLIVKAEKMVARGLYNPHTMQGDIVVNGVLCSSYTALVHPRLAHMLLGPVRMMYRMTSWNMLGSLLELGFSWRLPMVSY